MSEMMEMPPAGDQQQGPSGIPETGGEAPMMPGGLPMPKDLIPEDPSQIEGADVEPPEGQAQSQGPSSVGGLNHMLADRFGRLQKAVQAHGGMLYIYSGARDKHSQAQLLRDAVGKYGSVQEAKKHVALPGKSDHDPGAGLSLGIGDGAIGVDIRGDLAIAHKLAPHFGLEFDKKKPWHMRIAGVK